MNINEQIAIILNVMRSWNTDYGKMRFYESSNERYYVEFYNGGWSENEALQIDLVPLLMTVVDKHPIMLIKIPNKLYAYNLYNYDGDYDLVLKEIQSLCTMIRATDKYEVNL